MKRHLAILAGSLTLCAFGLLVMVLSRPGLARATAQPAPREGAKEPAEAPPKIATSRIVHVTIYPDSALVTREVDVPPGAGMMELVVNPLPEATMASSLYTEASEGQRVLTTRFRTRPVREDTREEVRKLDEEIKKLTTQQRKFQSEMQAIQSNVGLLSKLESFTEASTKNATEKGKLDSEATIALAKYLMDGRTEKSKQLLELQEQQQLLTEQMEFLVRKKGSLTTGTNKIERDAVVIVDKVNAAAGKVRLNYLVSSASWRPTYKFRAGKTSKDPVVMEYLANVVQQTGEDWERVDFTLSTAQPMLNSAPPDLHALAVAVVPRGTAVTGVSVSGLQSGLQLGGFGGMAPGMPGGPPGMGGGGMPGGGPGMGQMTSQPGGQMAMGGRGGEYKLPAGRLAIANPGEGAKPEELAEASKKLREQAQAVANVRNEKDFNELANYAAVIDQVRDLVVAKNKALERHGKPTQNEGPSVAYHLTSKLSVPSRPDEQVLEMARLEFEPNYYYKAVPVLTPHVYRQAELTNKSKYVLLPGEATMYNGSDFVGRMSLPLVAIGETFTAGFGAEPQLQVQRQMMDRSRNTQAGNQILKYEYRILISSYKSEKVKLQVWDRLPYAEKEAMGITLVKTAPELCKDPVYVREERSNNLLRWDLDIDPEMRGEKASKIQYEFQLELDKQAMLGNFQSK